MEKTATLEHRPFYLPIGKELEVGQKAHECQLPLLLKGPTGCGKTRFVEALAFDLGRDCLTVSCNEDTSATDLVGRYLLKSGETFWQDGPVTRAVRHGSILYLDEVAEAREDVVVLLHSLTDHRRELYVDRTGEILRAPLSFQLIASFNPGYQAQYKSLKPSTRQRFVTIEFAYPEQALENLILLGETHIESKIAMSLTGLAQKLRGIRDFNLKETISTRLLIHTAKLIQTGLPPRLSCEVGIVNALTDDLETRIALNDLVALHF